MSASLGFPAIPDLPIVHAMVRYLPPTVRLRSAAGPLRSRIAARPQLLVPHRPFALRRPMLVAPALPVSGSKAPLPAAAPPDRPNPYVDLSTRYTAEGGVEFTYKDIDDRLRWTVLRAGLWLAAMAVTLWFLSDVTPLTSPVLNGIAAVVMGWVYWLIVRKPVAVYRRIEIRPDCMILEGEDVFFREEFELGWPAFAQNDEGNLVLSGVSGTRAVEYLTVRRFDENDRGPEVLSARLRAAMQQQWASPA